MRHRKRRSKLSIMPSHRKALLRNLVRSLIAYQMIKTRLSLAKEARRLAEKLITISKEDTVVARRRAYVILGDRSLVARLFNDITPLFKTRVGGYTRIIPLGFRRGDCAEMAILELTEKKIEEVVEKKKKAKAAEDKAAAVTGEAKDAGDVQNKDDQTPKSAPKKKAHDDTKRREPKGADKKGFMKNIRGLFRKKGDM